MRLDDINGQGSASENGALKRILGAWHGEHSSNARQKLFDLKGFYQVVVNSRIQSM